MKGQHPLWPTIGIILAVAVSSGCAGQGPASRGEGNIMSQGLPSPDSKALWDYITQTNPYRSWRQYPGSEGLYPSISPYGAYVVLFINDVGMEAAEAGEPLPPGTILIRENYGKDQQSLQSITPMYKVQGYNPAGGDYFWAIYTPQGRVDDAGMVRDCIECHSAQSEHDWRFTEPVP